MNGMCNETIERTYAAGYDANVINAITAPPRFHPLGWKPLGDWQLPFYRAMGWAA